MSAYDFVEACFQQSDKQITIKQLHSDNTISGEEVIKELLIHLKKKMKISIIKWDPHCKAYPSYMLLSGDKGILAYVDFKYIESKKKFSESNFFMNADSLLETLRIAYSQLDRPVFFVYLLNCEDKQGIYFETNEQIKDRRLEKTNLSKLYFPVEDEMGDFDNLLALWNDLKKNNVRV